MVVSKRNGRFSDRLVSVDLEEKAIMIKGGVTSMPPEMVSDNTAGGGVGMGDMDCAWQ
jgi:hypothetical protein